MDTNNNNYYEEEEEISLPNLLAYVLRHFEKILIVCIIIGLFLGCTLGYKMSRNYEEEFNNDLNSYITSKEILDNKIELLSEKINDYINENSIIDLNSTNSYQAKALYFVDTGYRVIPDSMYQNKDYTDTVISAYVMMLGSNYILQNVAKEFDISENNVKDYITIYAHDFMIDINVYFNSEKEALNILHYLENSLESYNEELNTKIVKSTLTKISETVYQGANSNILEIQQNKLSLIDSYLDDLSNLQDKLNNLSKPVKENKPFIKQFVKYGAISFVTIFFMLCVYYALKFLFEGKVYSVNEFKDKTKIRVLGNLTYSNNTKYIKWFNKLENRPATNDFNLIISNFKAYENVDKVLLSGNLEKNVKDDILYNLKKLLTNVEIVSCGSFLTDSNAIDELKETDSVILLVKCDESSYKTIKEEEKKLHDLNINNIYAIIVE